MSGLLLCSFVGGLFLTLSNLWKSSVSFPLLLIPGNCLIPVFFPPYPAVFVSQDPDIALPKLSMLQHLIMFWNLKHKLRLAFLCSWKLFSHHFSSPRHPCVRCTWFFICCIWSDRSWNGPGNTVWYVEVNIPTHWLFLLDSRLIRIQTCFAEGHYLFLKIVMGSEFTINPKSSINLLGSMQDFSSFYFS